LSYEVCKSSISVRYLVPRLNVFLIIGIVRLYTRLLTSVGPSTS
jgi:hypothetical protein